MGKEIVNGPTAYVDKNSKLVWIVGSIDKKPFGETLKVSTPNVPEIKDGKISFEGKILLDKDQSLEGAIVGDLLPYLTTKVNAEVVGFKDLPAEELKEPVDEEGAFFGVYKKLDELKDENAMIIYSKGDKAAVLSSDEKDQKDRGIFVFKDAEDAGMALNTLVSYPPFKEKFFYKGAEVYQLNEVNMVNLADEKFIYFDIWQKCVANLSAHMSKIQ